jgi:hypothetical protein
MILPGTEGIGTVLNDGARASFEDVDAATRTTAD